MSSLSTIHADTNTTSTEQLIKSSYKLMNPEVQVISKNSKKAVNINQNLNDNLIQNGDFSQDFTNWYVSGDAMRR